jgi:hypothetical protein
MDISVYADNLLYTEEPTLDLSYEEWAQKRSNNQGFLNSDNILDQSSPRSINNPEIDELPLFFDNPSNYLWYPPADDTPFYGFSDLHFPDDCQKEGKCVNGCIFVPKGPPIEAVQHDETDPEHSPKYNVKRSFSQNHEESEKKRCREPEIAGEED